ncbi:MAG: PIN domain-containing protein [Thermomicrobiales bacterium]
MIVVDANYVLSAILDPVTTQDGQMGSEARRLFRAAESAPFTTTDAVVAEIVYVLDRKYGLARPQIAARLRPLLELDGCRLPTKRLCLRALDLWEENPKWSIVDAMVVAQAREERAPLATFDADVRKTAGVPLWSPPTGQNGSA